MVKIVFLTLVIFLTGLVSTGEAKKSLPIEKESPTSETEIICFAAKEKWVCAPATDQQQAKDKAMRLIDQKSQQEKVVINTIQQDAEWNEVVIEEPSTLEPSTASTSSSTAEHNANTNMQQVMDKSQTDVALQPETGNQSQSNVFSDWQTNHGNQWTLQAVGTTNLQNLERFIADNSLGNETMSVATTEVKGAPWHIILVGLFDDREQALAFKNAAQNNGAKWAGSAWPRPVNGIKSIN